MNTTLHDFTTAGKLTTGDQITVTDDEEEPTLRVMDPNYGSVSEVYVDGEPLTHYPGNEDCNPNSTAIVAVYEADLNRNVNNWEEWPSEELPDRLQEFEANWPDINVKRYIFPEEQVEQM